MSNDVSDVELAEKAITKRTSWTPMLTIQSLNVRRPVPATSMAPQRNELECEGGCLQATTESDLKYRSSLISLMAGDQLVKGSLVDCCMWYTAFLETKWRVQWIQLCSALKGLPEDSSSPQPGEFAVVYKFVITVANLLKTKRDVALVEIVDHLDNNDLLKQQLDDQRSIPNQLVFAAIGWLTMLYESQVSPGPDKLQITRASTSAFGYRNTLSTRTFNTYTLGFEYIDLPLYNLLNRFGDLIPELGASPARNQGFGGAQSAECIMPQYVCWDTLQNFVEIKIEWVAALSLHLEFDSGKRTLKLFRYPSYARMISCDRKSNLLAQLLNNHAASVNGDVRVHDVPTEEFFREILLSYRLIFGQDERSWRAFSKMIPWGEHSGMGSCESSCSCDPMLAILCGKSCNSSSARQIYDEIDADPTAQSYESGTDFQFFGRRLLELQSYVKQHRPRTLKALLSDRRDVRAWWTLWGNSVLIFFASFTILLVILQLVFQIWQVILAQQQLRQSQEFN